MNSNQIKVPSRVQQRAAAALALHTSSPPLEGVQGVTLATALVTGAVPLAAIPKIHRFFETYTKKVEALRGQLRTERDDPLVRSWALYGDHEGAAWAGREYRQAVSENPLLEDPLAAAYKMRPEEIYDAFSLGAWRYAYDLNPRKAARFVETYTLATGYMLELPKAFGESARAAANALYRRLHAPSPFEIAKKALMVEDEGYRRAVEDDLEWVDIVSTGGSATDPAKPSWGSFIAYTILAVEEPSLLEGINADSKMPLPPVADENAHAPPNQYHDAINTYHAFLHPDGFRYEEPVPEFAQVPARVHQLLQRAWESQPLSVDQTKIVLRELRDHAKENKWLDTLFCKTLKDWEKGNWAAIYDEIPPDADVKEAFEKFVIANPYPIGGVEVQQTLLETHPHYAAVLEAIADWPKAKWGDLFKSEYIDEIDATPIGATEAHQAAQIMEQPFGVGSLLSGPEHDVEVMGAFDAPPDFQDVFVMCEVETGRLRVVNDDILAMSFRNGTLQTKLGHKDLPGTHYNRMSDDFDMQPLVDYYPALLEWFEGTKWREFPLRRTQSAQIAAAEGVAFEEDSEFVTADSKTTYKILCAVKAFSGKDAGVVIIVDKTPDEGLMWIPDGDALLSGLIQARGCTLGC